MQKFIKMFTVSVAQCSIEVVTKESKDKSFTMYTKR